MNENVENIEFVFPGPYDQSELEALLYKAMTERARLDIQYAINNPHGEFVVQMGDRNVGVQWQFVGLEAEDWEEVEKVGGECEWVPVGQWYWEYGGPDFEVSCAWVIR